MKKANWSLINSLGKMKFSKTSYYYLVIIPILVKLTEFLNNPFILNVGQNSLKLNLELPFNWYLFYFGAISIAIGTFIYQLFCPDFVKKFKNYGEFLDAGESDNYLKQIESKYASNYQITGITLLSKPYLTHTTTQSKELASPVWDKNKILDDPKEVQVSIDHEYKINVKYQEERKNYFNELYAIVNEFNKPLIWWALIAYIIGFILFLFVIIQNILFVSNKMF